MRRVARDEALSLVLSAEAEKDDWVMAFRSQVLKNRLLDPEAVEAWIKRQVERDGPATIWREVPLKGKARRLAHRVKTLAYPGRDGWVARVPTAVGGVLDQLAGVARGVASQYGWQEAQATDFLLTGRTPLVYSLASEYRSRGPFSGLTRIALSIDPRVSPREVTAEYGRVRRRLLGARHRDQSEKHLTLAAFCASRADGEKLSKQMAAWNAKYPTWKYTGVTNFGRDKLQALQRLLRPTWHP